MAELDQIVQVTITKESTAISTASFNIPAVVAAHTKFASRTQVYTDMDAIAEDFHSTDKVYIIASKLFGNDVRPASIVVGRRQVDSSTFTPTVADNTQYTVTLNGTAYNFTSGVSATATTIVTGLKTAIGTPTGITVSGTTTLVLTVTTPGSAWSVSSSSNLVQVDTAPTETWAASLDAIVQENNTWYGLVTESHVDADILAIAAWTATKRKIYGASTQSTTVPTNATTDIASQLDALGYDRTYLVYLPTADSQYPEAAWMGSQITYTPGNNDWDFKQTQAGVTVSNISDAQRAFLRGKNCNMYSTVAGVDIFQDGNMVDGTPIDETIVVDWLYARLQEAVFFRLVNTLKIPFTRAGATIIEQEIRNVLSQAQTNLAIDAGWTVTAPDPLAIPAPQRAQRIMGDFLFNGRFAGSVRKVIIKGTIGV